MKPTKLIYLRRALHCPRINALGTELEDSYQDLSTSGQPHKVQKTSLLSH